MPKTKTTTTIEKRHRQRTGHSAGKDPALLSATHAYVYQGDRPTHVLVPIAEYKRWAKASMAKSAARKLEQKNTPWVDAGELGFRLAGERITAARKAAGLTQKELGAKLNLPQSQISRLERRPDHTTVRTLRRIAKALGVDISALV